MKYTYIIQGDPVPLARARYGQRKVWDSQKAIKLVAGINLKNQHGNRPYFQGPLILHITFFMEIPKSHYKKRLAGKPHYYKPDLSNLIKFAEDIATGITYHDDCLISNIHAYKIYDLNPRTELIIEEITNENPST